MNRITITLTEDQTRYILRAIETDRYELYHRLAKVSQTKWYEDELSFGKRVYSKLVKELNQDQRK